VNAVKALMNMMTASAPATLGVDGRLWRTYCSTDLRRPWRLRPMFLRRDPKTGSLLGLLKGIFKGGATHRRKWSGDRAKDKLFRHRLTVYRFRRD
jgi:hypothetical protein